MWYILIVIFAVILALSFAAFNYAKTKKLEEGNDKMKEIASAIRVGANTFLAFEYKILVIVITAIAVVLAVLVAWYSGVAFLIGATMSAAAGFFGMRIATYANVRVANMAKESKKLGATLKVALRGGSVMGLCVGGFALLGLVIVYFIFGKAAGQLSAENFMIIKNWMGVGFIPFTMTVSGYALGCSVIAIFNRVGGGIYTKAADMGADLVGKTEAGIPEDDARNPATIADNVGDNVGDVAGLGSDLLESFVGAIASAVILSFHLFLTSQATGGGITLDLLEKMFLFPIVLAAAGTFACVLGLAYVLFRRVSEKPHRELNMATWLSAGLTIALGLLLSYFVFGTDKALLEAAGFKLGFISPWLAAAVGVVAGIGMGFIAEYYTSDSYGPTKKIASSADEGAALTITQGMAAGMKSTMPALIVLAAAILVSHSVSGIYGVAIAAVGMLSFVTVTVSVDSYGPISDNAGGIAEMSGLDHSVREITDKLDAVGNTTAAIGKGFAIGSAALAALSLMVSYLYSYNDPTTPLLLNLINPMTLIGVLAGGALPYMFSGMLIEAVSKAARKMVAEVRRQFHEKPGILTGEELPDYKTCIHISTKGALREMIVPSLMSILVPVVTGFIFGPEFVGGILIGSTLSAIMLAIYTGNAGGAWDNAKKNIEGQGKKGSEAHKAAVVGDTVGDPLKDTVGPSLDIFIKIMSTVSLIVVSVFTEYNLFKLFS